MGHCDCILTPLDACTLTYVKPHKKNSFIEESLCYCFFKKMRKLDFFGHFYSLHGDPDVFDNHQWVQQCTKGHCDCTLTSLDAPLGLLAQVPKEAGLQNKTT